ncbi:universal stress protein [Antarcticibacterium arcticum]|uniref:Universal stress protein n=1 Tax=Antarcticibacterium arcticum TaxID=2585771 RepID=A0A5B8YLI1_9FLAO|nr:universal stress protein [Antarcticibacterium arcticum]QED36579.1 universal stress protein [Antarcticibacterium arcticum]
MKKILLPTDFSENAFNAIKYAVQLFQNEKCTFFLLNTYTPVLYDSDYILYSPAASLSLDEVYKNNSQSGLEKVKNRIITEYPNDLHSYELIPSFSLLNEEIKEQVQSRNIDLVIMGTQGATGAAQILFGTHTVHAIKRAICPLLAIPSGCDFKTPESILFPTDYDINYTRELLKLLKHLVKENNAKIHILHVFFGYPLEAEQEKSKKILANYFEDVPHQFYSIEKNTVTEGIYEFQEEHEPDVLAMISNKHSFFENLLFRPVINEIGFRVKTPFLVIPSGKFNK